MLKNKGFGGFAGRFILLHLAVYLPIAVIFQVIQGFIPEGGRLALDFFRPYAVTMPLNLLGEGIRGFILAVILYPFSELLLRRKRGKYVLFGALWGLALLGSLEPIPGSIEGIIYTTTTAKEHLLVMFFAALQSILFINIFAKWERGWGHVREG